MRLLGTEFLRYFGAPHATERLARIQGGLAAGYVAALRQRTLAEQERLSMAVLDTRKQVEEALRASEKRFRALFAGAAIGIGIAAIDGRILQVNQAFCDMFGYPAEELLQINVSDLVMHPHDIPGMWELYADLVNGVRDHVRVDKRYFRKDGAVIRTDLTVSLIRDENGAPQFTVAMIADSTERYALADRLRCEAAHDTLTGLAAVAEPVDLAGVPLGGTAGAGVLDERAATSTAAELMKAADVTLYWAKDDGRACWALFDAARHDREQARYALASAMPAAL